MQKRFRNIIATLCLLTLAACAIKNDIPYPLVDGSIQAMEVEGQCDSNGSSSNQAIINKDKCSVTLYVDDTVDLSKVRITSLSVTNSAKIVVDPAICANYEKFPTSGFESLDDLTLNTNTCIDLSKKTTFVLRTYQDYPWEISVERIVKREIVLESQIGDAVVDDVTHKVVIFVSNNQPLNKIKVSTFSLGGQHGTVTPNPLESDTYDFSKPVEFSVRNGWEETENKWTVYVYQKEEENTVPEVFSRTKNATLTGKVQNGKQVSVEYKKQGENNWTELQSSAIEVSGTNYTATIDKLSPSTTYVCRVNVGDNKGDEQTFTTSPATPLTDGDFDNWHKKDKLWNPWAEDGTSFWDTGNRGAVTIGDSNSVPTDDTCNGSGKAAFLESKWLVMKFAAGNMISGSYLKTVGTNGILSFGREFSAFPTKLRVNYKYTTTTIEKIGDDMWQDLKGRPDSCFIWIALTDWDKPREIRTRPSERQLFEINDPHVIAYAELIKGEDVTSWTKEDLVLKYRYTNRRPKYIVVVATSSKYGDYFTGGVGSKLWIDNFELLYD